MVAKFSRSKTPHPTPPVCKASEPNPTPDLDACVPTNVLIAITILGFNSDGTIVNGAGGSSGTNGGAGTVWESHSVVLGLDIVAQIQRGTLPERWIPSAVVTTPLGSVHLMGSGMFDAAPCPPFRSQELTRPLVPGPGTITLQIYS
jgi:hypothetical protein